MALSQYDTLNYAQYVPRTTEEIWKPLAYMRENHDKLEEEYSQQEQQGGLSLTGIDPQKDKAAYEIQQNYINETKKAADELATKGFIEGGRRKNLYSLKQQYAQQVVPLQQQLALRNARADELRKIQLSDPTFRATNNPTDIPLVDGLKNPNAFSYSGVSGNQLQSSVAKKAEQLGKVISQEHPELIHSKLFGQYFTALQSGASIGQVDAAMRKQFDSAKVDKMTGLLHGLVSSTLTEFGVPDKFKGNQSVQDELWGTAAQGLYSAIGSKQFGQMTDSFAIDARKKALEDKSSESGYLQDIQSDPEIIQGDRFKKNDDLINHISTGKYKKSSTTGGFNYDAEVKKIQNDKTMSNQDRNNALAGLARANNFGGVGQDRYYNEQIEKLGKKYKTTNLSEIKNRLAAENEFLKVAYSQHGITGKDNYPLKNILSSISSYPDVDISDLKDSKGNVDESTTKIYQHPTKGLVIQGVDSKGKVVVKKLPADIIGNPALVKRIGANTLPVLTEQILNGAVDINKMISSGELKPDPKNRGHYMFVKPVLSSSGEYYNNTSYTADELNNGIYQPELMNYINGRQSSVYNQYESRLQGQNKGYDVGPDKK